MSIIRIKYGLQYVFNTYLIRIMSQKYVRSKFFVVVEGRHWSHLIGLNELNKAPKEQTSAPTRSRFIGGFLIPSNHPFPPKPKNSLVQSDPYLVTPDLVTPLFSARINFPRYRKLTVFDPDLVPTPI
eukprot:sb/3475464/